MPTKKDESEVLAYITVSFLEDGSVNIDSDSDLTTRIELLKLALEHDLYNASMLLAKDPNGFPIS